MAAHTNTRIRSHRESALTRVIVMAGWVFLVFVSIPVSTPVSHDIMHDWKVDLMKVLNVRQITAF